MNRKSNVAPSYLDDEAPVSNIPAVLTTKTSKEEKEEARRKVERLNMLAKSDAKLDAVSRILWDVMDEAAPLLQDNPALASAMASLAEATDTIRTTRKAMEKPLSERKRGNRRQYGDYYLVPFSSEYAQEARGLMLMGISGAKTVEDYIIQCAETYHKVQEVYIRSGVRMFEDTMKKRTSC